MNFFNGVGKYSFFYNQKTDLIRFNRFIEGDYLWPYKGGPAAGQAINPKFKVYPLPLSDIIANPNLTQNDGY